MFSLCRQEIIYTIGDYKGFINCFPVGTLTNLKDRGFIAFVRWDYVNLDVEFASIRQIE
jgi:hypothetical protein